MATLDFNSVVRTTAGGQTTSTIVTANNIGSYAPALNSTYYIGTTQNVFNRASASQTLTGVSIDGNAANITAYTINQNVGTGNTPSFAGLVSSAVTNYAFLQVTDTNNFWITPGNNNWGLYFETSAGGLLGGTGDSNRLGFVGAGTARFYVDLNNGNGWFGASLTANTDSRAPIFYDSANTAYYLDPNNTGTSLNTAGAVVAGTYVYSTTYLQAGNNNIYPNGFANTLILNAGNSAGNSWITGISIAQGGNVGVGTSGPDTNLQVVGHIHVGNQTTFDNTGGWNKTIYLDGTVHARMRIIGSAFASGKNSQTETNIWVDNSVAPYSGLTTNAGSFTINAGFTTLTNSARSPIFYDSDNTAYYIDAASTSNIVGLTTGSMTTTTGGTSIFIGNQNVTTANALRINWHTDADLNYYIGKKAGSWTQPLDINFYTGIRLYSHSSYDYGISFWNSNGTTLMMSVGESDNNVRVKYNIYAQILYDLNNTSYYIDPASTSNLNTVTVNDVLTYGVVAAKSFSVSVNTSTYWTVVRPNGSSIATGYVYRITLCTTGTGTDTGEQYLLANVDSAGWVIKTVTKTGSGSNWPYVFLDAGVPKVKTDHASLYTVTVLVEELNSGNTGGLPSVFGLAGLFTSDNGTPKYRAGWFSSDNTLLHSGNYSGYSAFSGSVSSGGNITATGYIYTSTYLQTGGNLIYPSGYGATQRLEVSNSANNNWIDGITIAPGGIVTAPYEMRSPIFYDSDNTAYYINAAGTSVLNALTVGGNNVLTTASTLTAGNLSGTIPSGVLGNSTLYVGTTAIALNRGSASQTLTGISIDGNAATASNATQFGGEANTNFMRGLAGGTEANINNYTDNGFRTVAYTGHGKGLLSFNVGSSIGTVQHEYFYNIPTNGWRVRNKTDNTTWSSWGNIVMTDTNQGALTGTVITTGNSSGLSPTFSNLYAAIFYDAADSTYYLDPANTTLSLKTRSSIVINNASAPNNLAMLNIGYSGSGETRAIDIQGGWSGGENKSITFTHASSSTNIVAQINAQHNGPASRLRWGKLYHGGDSSTYTMELISESTTSAYLTVAGSVRAPIFYDSNDTNYYVDPASTSLLNATRSVSIVAGSNSAMTGSPGSLAVYSASSPYISFHDGGVARTAYLQEAGGRFYFGDVPYTESEGSFRAPSFYDVNDTTYYLDPASTSVMLYVRAANFHDSTGSYNVNLGSGNSEGRGLVAGYSGGSYGGIGYNVRHTTTGGSWIAPSTDTSTYLLFSNGIYFYYAAGGAAGRTLSYSTIGSLTSAGIFTVSGDVRAPLFYDSNNTAYYLDPASTSNLNVLNAVSSTTLWVRSGSWAGDLTSNGFTREIGMQMTGGSEFVILSKSGQGYTLVDGSYYAYEAGGFYSSFNSSYGAIVGFSADSTTSVTFNCNVKAPIYYDSNNTSYYLDPNSTTSLRTVGSWRSDSSTWDGEFSGKIQYHANHWYFQAADSWLFRSSGGNNVVSISQTGSVTAAQYYTGGWFRNNSSGNGLYNESTGQHFYSDAGDMWNVASANGTQGIRLRTGGHNGTIRGYFYGNDSNDVGFLNNAGSWRVRVVGGDYALFDGSSIRGQIFYDSNNTAFYIDAASTSVLNSLTVTDGNLELYKSQTVDMSNTTTYSTSNYYPVTIPVPTEGCIIQIQNNLNSNVPSWATHGSGFTLNLKWRTNGFGWGTTQVRRIIDQYFEQFTNQTICGGITQMGNSSTEVVWLRGGGQYYFKFSRNLSATAQSATYTVSSQSVSPTSTAQNTIWSSAGGSSIQYNDQTISTTNMYTPVLYDWNNSAYYVDPASTSNLVGLTVANTITGSITGNAGGSSASCTGNAATATRTSGQSGYPHAGTGMFAFYNWGGSDGGTSAPSASTYTTGLSVGSNPGDQAYGFQIANNMWNTGLWTRNYNSGFGSWIRLLDSSNYVGYSAFTGNVDGTQFRDANNTAYYIDPASTSNLVGLTVANTITGAVSGNAGSVTINYNNDSNSTYQMLWGSGNNVYGTAGVYLNPSTDYVTATSFNASDWFRSSGATGWYNSTYGGGIYMTDTTWVRTYNSKYFYCDTIIQAGSDMRSPVYYDANDTAYYVDAASTSNLLLVKTRNTFGERVAVSATASTTINTQYNVTELTLAATITTLTLSNIQASGTVHMWTIVTVGGGVGYSITWPAAVKWPGGTAPTLTTTSNKRDIYQFVTYDGGTTIFAIIVGQNL